MWKLVKKPKCMKELVKFALSLRDLLHNAKFQQVLLKFIVTLVKSEVLKDIFLLQSSQSLFKNLILVFAGIGA